MNNKQLYSIFFILVLIFTAQKGFSQEIYPFIINDYQVFAEIKPGDHSQNLRRLATNMVSVPVYESFISGLKNKSRERLGIDLTDHTAMAKIGIDTTTTSAVVFNDVFFSQSFYVVIKLKEKEKFFEFLKTKCRQEAGNRACGMTTENVNGTDLIVFKAGDTIHYTVTNINGYFVVSKNHALVKKAVEAIKAGNTLNVNEFHKRTKALLGSAFVTLYIKPQVFSQAITGVLLMTGNAARISFNYAFLNIFTDHSFSVLVENKMLGLNIHSGFNPQIQPGELFGAIEPGNSYGQNIIDYLPKNPYLFLHSDTAAAKLIHFLKGIFPSFKQKIEAVANEIRNQLSIDFESDVLGATGTSFGLALYNFDPTIIILNPDALRNMNAIMYMESTNPGGLNLALLRLKSNIKKIDPSASVSVTLIRGMSFYHIKSRLNIYIGMFNRYILIGTQKEALSKLIWNMLTWQKTGFQQSLRAPEFTERLKNKTVLSFYVNLERVFSNSILPPLVKEYGVNLMSLKNLYFSSRMENNHINSIFRLYFK